MADLDAHLDKEFRVDIGRADKCRTFVRVVHMPTGKQRIVVGLAGKDANAVAKDLAAQLQVEIRSGNDSSGER